MNTSIIVPTVRALFAVTLAVIPAAAQQATVQGEVRDSSEAVIVGVYVNVLNISTGTRVTSRTNESGFYSIQNLIPGLYTVTADSPGFTSVTQNNLRLEVDQVARVDFVMKVGGVAESVDVSATANLLNTDTAVVGQTVQNRTIVELPLNGRNYLQLSRLSAGVSPDFGSRTSNAGTFSALGQSAYQVSVRLDGIDNSSRASGGQLGYEAQAVTPSVDAVEEFKVITNNNSAEYGGRIGGTVIVQTKSGTNDFHGTAYEFLRNEKLDGTNFFSVGQPKPPYRQNQFGGTFGGPIKKNKLFFFASTEATRIRQGQTAYSTVPTAAQFGGDFSKEKPIYDPATTRQVNGASIRDPFPSNQIPVARFDPVAAKAFALYPKATLPGLANNYYYSGSLSNDTNQYDGRADYNITPLQRVFVRFSRREYDNVTPGKMPIPADGGSWSSVWLRSNSMVASWNAVLSPTANNEFRVGHVRTNSVIDIPWTQNYDATIGLPGLVPLGVANSHGMTEFIPANYTPLGPQCCWPNTNNLGSYQINDMFSKITGTHVLKVGADLTRNYVYRLASRYARGAMNFDGSFTQNPASRGNTGDGLADLLLGMASGGTYGNLNGESVLTHGYSGFVQDDWRVSKRLTLYLGLRWDRFGFPSFHATPVSRIVLTPGSQNYTMQRPKDSSDCGCIQNNKNFAPRVGFAFQASQNWVIRSGFGIYYGDFDALGSDAARFFNQAPDFVEYSFSSDRLTTPALTVSKGFPAGLFPTTVIQPNVSVTMAKPSAPNQYALEWFFDVQRLFPGGTVITASYMGLGSRQGTEQLNMDTPYTPGAAALQSRRPWPFFSNVYQYRFGNTSDYQGLTLKGEKRFAKGLTFIASYTWSHAILEGGGLINDLSQSFRNPYNLALDRGNSPYDLRHNAIISFVYDLPFGNGRTWLNRKGLTDWVLGDWQTAGIFSARTGQYFTPTISTDITNTGTTNFPNRVGNGALSSGQRNINRWFDVSAFAIPAEYTYGTSGQNILEGPGFINMDFNLSKRFQMTERFRLEFRAESFNLTNTPHFGLPNATINSPAAGTIRTAAAPRQNQFGLKLLF